MKFSFFCLPASIIAVSFLAEQTCANKLLASDARLPVTQLSQLESAVSNQIDMIPGLGGGGGGPPDSGDDKGGPKQNAPLINVVNNSRMTTAWARKAWKEEMARKAKHDQHTMHKAKSFGLGGIFK